MRSKPADAALRDILYHIELATVFARDFTLETLSRIYARFMRSRAVWRLFPKRPVGCPTT